MTQALVLKLSNPELFTERVRYIVHMYVHIFTYCMHIYLKDKPIEEGFIQKQRQMSSLLSEGQNLFNSLPL